MFPEEKSIMPYARTNYTLIDVGTMLAGRVNVSVSAGGGGTAAPNPHAGLHVPTDELHSHPLFQKARISSGDVGTHSVAKDTNQLKASLLRALNSAAMQTELAKLDPPAPRAIPVGAHPNHAANLQARNTAAARMPVAQRNNIWVNINFNTPQGEVDEFSDAGGSVATRQFRFRCLGVKLMVNPGNRDVPIMQTCVPMENPKAGGVNIA